MYFSKVFCTRTIFDEDDAPSAPKVEYIREKILNFQVWKNQNFWEEFFFGVLEISWKFLMNLQMNFRCVLEMRFMKERFLRRFLIKSL